MRAAIGLALLGLGLCLRAAAADAAPDLDALAREVADTERAFARSMAERDHAAFTRFLSPVAVFMGQGARAPVLRGAAAVAADWKPLFEGAQAPFSWAPDRVEVLADGALAHSSGPVRNAAGAQVGRFYSVWRREAPGVWRVVFDRGDASTD